ncbi:glucosyltransferase domain-containing protein [Francisella adeliensis]|uniref:Glycosyltransferase RgtA/B/C/D-like domain-containing protein n=1 Tax=Francisella adeliensis TaxID=2007306 RepID=A0A2Z4XWS8_9GAMM|nr:glucosyltransferase domain-containing protein [Francisella adeliensis]AXA33150.1 hypothetical protein CDH04_01375 [Francisella adeliensis]MBK2085958.1 glucosyltransferase domain-containing protein [Francisella adeliensis]MBK2096878.1 glucosyltransferase domain-containing protein [Francisella adeliensis]QIW11378.1 hypothetical protein FZC43_01375 [Francisella adeliensis]QIW13253.1 hypothetical protein FZC44_01375 [Francisella adeliensis]
MSVIKNLKNYSNSVLDWSSFDGKKALLLMLISLLFFYPILYGHGIYTDDLHRLETGAFWWLNDGRPLTYLIGKMYSLTRGPVIDPTPYNWIISIALIGVAAKLVYLHFANTYKQTAFMLASIFIANPFFIQNMLYRFDSISMALAVFFCVLGFCIRQECFFLKILLLFISMNFYQTAYNLFLGLMAIDLLIMFSNPQTKGDIRKYLIKGFLIFFLVTVCYFIEKQLFLHVTQGRSSLLSISSALPLDIFKNYYHAFTPFMSFWKINFIFIIPAILLMGLALLNHIFTHKNISFIFGCSISLLLVILSSLGFMVLLAYQMDFFQVRVYMYFPVVIMFIYIICDHSFKNAAKIVILPILFACFIFSARVGNIQQLQEEFEKPIFYGLTVDIYDVKNKYGINEFNTIGQVPYSAFISNSLSQTPFYGFMSRYEGDTRYRLLEYGNKDVYSQFYDDSAELHSRFDKEKNHLTTVKNRPYYFIYINNTNHNGWIVWKTVWLLN